jgi:hypothetical protein
MKMWNSPVPRNLVDALVPPGQVLHHASAQTRGRRVWPRARLTAARPSRAAVGVGQKMEAQGVEGRGAVCRRPHRGLQAPAQGASGDDTECEWQRGMHSGLRYGRWSVAGR